MEYSACKCYNCESINIIDSKQSDGFNCAGCGGPLKPLSNSVVCNYKNKRRSNDINIKANVDTTEIDSSIEKARTLRRELESIKKVLIIESHGIMRDKELEEEQNRIASLTGMRVCILQGRYKIGAIEGVLDDGKGV